MNFLPISVSMLMLFESNFVLYLSIKNVNFLIKTVHNYRSSNLVSMLILSEGKCTFFEKEISLKFYKSKKVSLPLLQKIYFFYVNTITILAIKALYKAVKYYQT